MSQKFGFTPKLFKRIFFNVRNKYRLVIMDESFHEKLSFRLSRLNVLVSVSVTAISLVVITICLIVFTDIREYIPGYTNEKITQQAYHNEFMIDSLQKVVATHSTLISIIKQSFDNQIPEETVQQYRDSLKDYSNIKYRISIEDSMLRKEMQKADKYNVRKTYFDQTSSLNNSKTHFLFFTPLNGKVQEAYDHQSQIYGITINGQKNEVIKTVLDGVVILTDWTPESNHIVMIQHENNTISIYKYCSSLLVNPGDFIKSGDPIAFIGNSGNRTIPQLYFELWISGSAVNPQDYIIF